MADSFSIEAILKANVDNFVAGFKKAEDQAKTFVDRNAKTFDSFKKVGAAATAGGLAIAAGLGGAVKVAANFEAGMSEVAAISGATGADLQMLSDKAREMGSSTSFSATEAAEGLKYMSLAGWSAQESAASLGGVLNLAEAGALDLGRASDLVTDSMAGLGLGVNDLDGYLDKVAQTSRKSNTDIDALMEAFVIAGGTFERLNVPLEESSAMLGVLANRGFKGSEAGTAMNAIMARLTSTTGPAAKALEGMGIAAYDSEGNFRGMETVMKEVEAATAGMTDAEKAHAIEQLAGLNHGKTFSAMLSGLGDEYDSLKNDIVNSDGALKDMRDTMKDNLQGAMENLSSAFEEIAISIGTALLPMVKQMAEFVQNLADKFNGLDEKTKTTIAVIAALAAGFLLLIGPIFMLIGFIPAMLAGFTALSTVIGAIVSPVGLAVAAIAGLAVAWYASFDWIESKIGTTATVILGLMSPITQIATVIKLVKRGFEDAIEPVERFADGVSESTQKAVGAFMDMSEQANVALKEVVWGQQEMNAEMATNMIAGQQEITDTLLSAIGERHAQEKEATQEQFAQLEGLSEEQRASIIQKTNEHYAKESVEVETGNKAIADIIQKASDEKRAITQDESDAIMQIREGMTVLAVAVMSESAEEQKLIYERMKDNAETITALEAAEVVKNSVKKKEEVVQEANDQYTETRLWAEQQRDELGTMSAEEAELVIEEARKKRDESVIAAADMHTKVVDEAKAQAKEHVNEVDWSTGEIKSKWQVMKEDVKTKAKDMWKSTTEWFQKTRADNERKTNELYAAVKQKWEDMKATVTDKAKEMVSNAINKFVEMHTKASQKLEDLKTAVRQKFEDVKTAIREKLTEAVTTVATKVGEMPGKVREFVSDMLQAGKDLVGGLITGITNMGKDAVEAITGVVDGVVNKAKSLLGIASPSKVFTEFGGFISEGMAIGIADKSSEVEKAITDLSLLVIDIAEHYAKEEANIAKKSGAEIASIEKRAKEDVAKINNGAASKKRKTTADENVKIQRIQESAINKIASIEKKAVSDSVKLLESAQKGKLKEIKLYIEDKKSLDEISLSDEARLWKSAIEVFSEGSKERITAQKNYNKASSEADKQRINQLQNYVADKKKSGEMSLSDEIRFWNAMYGAAEYGSELYESAMENHQKAVKELRGKIESVNKEYNDKMIAINKEFNAESDKLHKEASDAYDTHFKKLLGFAGVFDSFAKKSDVTGQDLVKNLKSQVTALDEYGDVINSLSGRIDNKDLLKELKSLGVKSLGELQALNRLSDTELEAYANLYGEKFRLAKEQTDAEMQPMMDEIDNKLVELKKDTSKRLDDLDKEWQSKIKQIVRAADKEFDSMKQVGIDAMTGLRDGMDAMSGPLLAKAQSIANAIKRTIQDAFDINSPSRWMHDMIGKNMMVGWIDGMESMKSKVIAMAVESADWMRPDVGGLSVPSFNGVNTGGYNNAGNSNTVNGSARGDFKQTVIINSPKHTSPSENARLMKQQSRQLATEWGV